MKFLQRWTTTLTSTVDGWAGRLENHEALVDARLRDVHDALHRARSRVRGLRRDAEKLREQIAKAESDAASWHARAARQADDERAMACLSRRRRCQAEKARAEARLATLEGEIARLTPALTDLEARAKEMREQRDVMRTREAQADAVRQMERGFVSGHDSLEGIFSRWEEKIGYDGASLPLGEDDPLERELSAEEEARSLSDELAALRAEAADA